MSRIAVNTRFLLAGQLEGYGNFLQEILKKLVSENPQHQFIFFFDRPYDSQFIYGNNVSAVVAGPPARHPLLWNWWFNVRLPLLFRKHKVDLFLSTDGFCSLRSSIPQVLLIHDLAFLHFPEGIKKSHARFYKRNTPRFIRKAAKILTVSSFSQQDIAKQYGLDPGSIGIIPNAARAVFQSIPEEKKQLVREKYSNGRLYFLYTGSIHPRKNLIRLLRAFSQFKKRQRSNIKLIIAGRLAWNYQSFTEALRTYKFREDVVLTGYLPDEDLAELTASAYAMVYVSVWEGFGLPVIEAFQAGVPVITSAGSAMADLANGAALLADPADPAAIAEQMMLVYKDENLRSALIKKGLDIAHQYSWDESARRLSSELENLL